MLPASVRLKNVTYKRSSTTPVHQQTKPDKFRPGFSAGMEDEASWRLEPLKRFTPTLAGFTLGCLVFLPRLSAHEATRSFAWLLGHALCGPFEKVIFNESVGLTHTDVFFGAVLLFILGSHVLSMSRATLLLSIVGSFLWVAAAVGHYG